MKKLLILLIAFASAGLVACGGGEVEGDGQVECGEDTVEVDGVCVVAGDCPDGQVEISDGRCVRSNYCADGTHLDLNRGTCVADTPIFCGDNTSEEDGECLPDFITTCGAGTVVADGRCLPYDDVCGEGTEVAPQADCRPAPELCGHGTAFDVQQRTCVRISSITCGVGTIATDGQCLALSALYENLAETPDLDRNEPGTEGHITLKEPGSPFVFIGTIDSIVDTNEDDEEVIVADEDVYTFDGEAGQVIRIGLYSLGLPDPGFEFNGDDGDYWRMSPLGAGTHAIRQLVLPVDGEYELTISTILQLSGIDTGFGGDDWNYVGFVEVLAEPLIQNINVKNGLIAGSLLDAESNHYRIIGAEAEERLPLFLVNLPTSANLEFLIWEAGSTEILRVAPGEEELMILPAPSDEFFIFVDHDYADGQQTNYNTRISTDGIRTEEVAVAANEFLRVSQSNGSGASLNISVDLDGVAIGEQTLPTINSAADGRYFHDYSPEGGTYFITAYASTGEPLSSFDLNYEAIAVDTIDGVDGSLLTHQLSSGLTRGQIQYFFIESTYDDMLAISVDGSEEDAALTLFDLDGDQIATAFDTFIFTFTPDTYLLAVEALNNLPAPLSLTIDVATIFEVAQSSSPNAAIPDNNPSGVSDSISISNCPSVAAINMDINISHNWRGDLEVKLTDPGGTTRTLFARAGGNADDLIGNFNQTLSPQTGSSASSTAQPIENFEGTGGTGTWTLTASDHAAIISGTLHSWGLNLTCEG